MRRLLLFVMIISSFSSVCAQESTEQLPHFRKNDILIDPFWLIGGLALNASYERIISEDSGIGANAIFGFGEDLEEFTQISPFYRAYFGSKYASGFFIEGFAPITVSREYDNVFWTDENNRGNSAVYTTGGLGFGIGAKWVAKKKFVFELNIGIARKFIGDRGPGSEVTGKGMLGVGFAF